MENININEIITFTLFFFGIFSLTSLKLDQKDKRKLIKDLILPCSLFYIAFNWEVLKEITFNRTEDYMIVGGWIILFITVSASIKRITLKK